MQLTKPFQDLFSSGKAGGLLLVFCAAVSLVITNTAWGAGYAHFWHADLGGLNAPADLATIAGYFEGKKTKKKLEEITRLLETLGALGRAVEREGGWVSSG